MRGTDLNAKHIKETKCGHNIYLNRVDLTGTHGLMQFLEGQHAGYPGFLLLSKLRPREARPRAGGLSNVGRRQISPTAFSAARISAWRLAISSPIGGPWKRLFSKANQTMAVRMKKPTVM